MPRNTHFVTLFAAVLLVSVLAARPGAQQAHTMWHKPWHGQPRVTQGGSGRSTQCQHNTHPWPCPALAAPADSPAARKLLLFFTVLVTSSGQDDEMRQKEILQENPFPQLGNRAAAALLPRPHGLHPSRTQHQHHSVFHIPHPWQKAEKLFEREQVNSSWLSEKKAELWQSADFPRLRFGQGLGSPSPTMPSQGSRCTERTNTTRGNSLSHNTHTAPWIFTPGHETEACSVSLMQNRTAAGKH